MTAPTTTTPTTVGPETTAPGRTAGLARGGVVAALAATAAVTVLAAATHALGASLEVDGEAIPLLGFAQLTGFWSLVGLGIAALVRRRAAEPARTFVRLTVGLTVLSCVPSVLIGADVATTLTLVSTHLVAAAIVIPVLARRLG